MPEARRLRIIHCFRSPVGGIFRHVRDLAQHHSRAGHEVGILCDSTTGGSFEDALFDDIRPFLTLGLTRLPIRRAVGPSDLRAAYASFRKIKGLRPDILHGHGAKGGVFARVIGRRLCASDLCGATLYSPHGGSLHYSRSNPAGRFYFAVERLLERSTDRLVFVSDYERLSYEAKVGVPKAEWSLVRNGLREDEFQPVASQPDAADFLYIGMMRDLKGPDVFIDAFARTERLAGRPLRAVMVGDGEDKPRYETMIMERGLSGRIAVHPAMPARQAFALARTVCIPSRAESMPYIVLEALAAGKPLLASRVGGIPEIVGRDNPALADPGDAADLARLMARACGEPDWLPAALPGPDALRKDFSASAMAAGMLDLYEACLSGTHEAAAGAAASNLS